MADSFRSRSPRSGQGARLRLAALFARFPQFSWAFAAVLLALPSLIVPPGAYTISYSFRLGNVQSRDEQGNVLIPGKEDWQGSLATGETTLTVRARTPEDDAREREPTFVGRIEFVGPESRAIESGMFTASTAGQRREPAEYALHAGQAHMIRFAALGEMIR